MSGSVHVDAEMHLKRTDLEPAAAALDKLCRLRLFAKAEHAMIKCPRFLLAAGRHRSEEVIDMTECHSPPSTCTFFNSPPAQKATHFPSGEKNGPRTPSVPGNSVDSRYA